MVYTVKQLASLAGVTIRTLHYYDEIGLLKPSFVKANGYRYYGEKELLKLQQILFFRELEFSLEQILRLFQAPNYSPLEALADQRTLLQMKRARLDSLLDMLEQTLEKLKKGEHMSNTELFSSFDDSHIEQYKEEVQARWGETEAYKQSQERMQRWTRQDAEQIQAESQSIILAISASMARGIADTEVQNQIERHFQHIRRFYDCSYTMYRNLGNMYCDDPRFAAYYNQIAPHLAAFMRDAIAYYCSVHENE
jgi:DNA-binding transcriptional MerR regulator